jgi:hypothetical protein
MKNTIYLFAILLCYLPLKAQQIIFKGVLYEHNSKTNTGKLKAIQNAQIIIPFTVPSTTDNMGKFKTESDGYKVGQSTKIIIKKAGYEVVNIKDLENVVAGSIDEVKVYLAPQNLLYEAQLKYYNLAKKSIETSYDVKLNKLINDLNKYKIANKDNKKDFDTYLKSFTGKSQDLEIERNNALKSAQDVAKNIAEINLDFADNLYKKAIGYFLKGSIDSCLILLNSNQFSKQEQKAIENINKQNELISKEAQILKTIIDKDLFRAQLYQTKLQMDSVSSICKKASELNFKYVDAIGMKEFISINKKIINIDPNYTFTWLNNDYFEDFISTVRLKSGRGSLDEAEAIRLQGVYKMNVGEGDAALELLIKSLGLLKKNNSQDSAMVLTNMLDLRIKFAKYIGRDAFQLLQVKNHNNKFPGQFQENPYWFETVFDNPKSIEYGIKTLLKAYETFNYTLQSSGTIDNALTYILNPNNIRNYSSEFINYLKVAKIKITADRNNGITSKNIEQLINYGDYMNVNSFDYLNYLHSISRLYLEEFALTTDHQEDNKEVIANHIKSIFPALQKNTYFSTLTGDNKFKYDMVNIIFMYIFIKTKNNSFSIDVYVAQLNSITNVWLKYMLSDSKGIGYENAYSMCKLYWKTYGCNFGSKEMRDFFLKYSKLLAEVGSYNGVALYKTFLELAFGCDDSLASNTDLIFHFENLINYSLKISDNAIDTGNARYGILFSPVFDEKSPFFSSSNSKCLNNIEEFYYGSDYAINVGKSGVVTKLKGWEYGNKDITNYDSLWRAYTYNVTIGDEQKVNQIFEIIYNNSMAKYVKQNKVIDSIQFSDSKIVYPQFTKFTSNISSSIWRQYGNSRLVGLDQFFNKLMWNYDDKHDYSKIIETLYKFNHLGLPEFFLGYSKCYGTMIQYLSHIYTLGLKATLIKKDTKAYDDFVKLSYSTLNRLSDRNKIQFLNDFIFSTYDENKCVINNQASFVDFNTPFINQLYKDFEKLLANDSLIKYKSENVEDRTWQYEKEEKILESYLTLSGASQLDNFNPAVFTKLKNYYPTEARVYRNEALYYFRKNNQKLGLIVLKKAIELGFKNSDFFINKIEIKKYHSKILECFN